MNDYVALFRGINVAGKNVITMATLSAMLEKMGCLDVKTYIQSGNVVFRSAVEAAVELAQQITSEIEQQQGITSRVLVLTATAFESAVAQNPYGDVEGKALHVYFLAAIPDNPDIARLNEIQTASESFALQDQVFFLHAPDGIGRSKLAAGVEKCLGVSATARNWNTVKKLRGIMAGDD